MCVSHMPDRGLGQSHVEGGRHWVDMYTGLTIRQAGHLKLCLLCKFKKWGTRPTNAFLDSQEGKGTCWGHEMKAELTR